MYILIFVIIKIVAICSPLCFEILFLTQLFDKKIVYLYNLYKIVQNKIIDTDWKRSYEKKERILV